MNSNLVEYDDVNKGMVTVPAEFAKRNTSVLSWVWRNGIAVGVQISPGAIVADIQWDNNTTEPIYAPANCTGRISQLNRNINFANLRYPPPIYVLFVS